MAWCIKCHYGNETAKITKCPQCGSTEVTTERPFAKRDQQSSRNRQVGSSKEFDMEVPEFKTRTANWASHGIYDTGRK